jgi:hypothetical protein
MEQVAATIREWVNLGWRVAFGRVIDVQGFGGSSQEELFAVNELGDTAGRLLSGTLDDLVLAAAWAALDSRSRRPRSRRPDTGADRFGGLRRDPRCAHRTGCRAPASSRRTDSTANHGATATALSRAC